MIKKFVMRSTSWLLRNYRGKMSIATAIEDYQEKINQLAENIDHYVIGKFKDNYEAKIEKFIAAKVPHDLARKIAILGPLSSAYNIAEVANKYKISAEQVANIYFELGQRFSIDWLRDCANSLKAENNWQKLAISGFKDELYDIHRKITAHAVEYSEKSGNLEKWFKQNEKHIKLFDRFILEVKTQDNIEYAMIDLTLKKLGILLAK